MSRILWKRALTPPPDSVPGETTWDVYDGVVRAPLTLRIPLADEALVDLPDPRAYRALSRAGLLLAAIGLQSRDVLQPFVSSDPYGVGLYCAMESGPNDYRSAKLMIDTPREAFAATYKNLRSAKQYFKMLPNVPPSELAIFVGAMGPMAVFNHSRHAGLHALDQAEHDLHAGLVKAALVCSAFSLEDPLVVLRTRRVSGPAAVLCEGAACLVLIPDGHYTDWRASVQPQGRCVFGIANDIVAVASRSESDDDGARALRSCGERDQGGAEHRWPRDLAHDVPQPRPGS
jgi:hypothetical protein